MIKIVKNLEKVLVRIVLFFIKTYQIILSPDHGLFRFNLPAACRFQPTCSQYAYQAFQKYGLARGFILSMRRIIKCHPWQKGGWDPVK
jgi:hypothetical protein